MVGDIMFWKKKSEATHDNSNDEIVRLLTEIRDLLKEGRLNAILTGVLSNVDNQSIERAAGALYGVAIAAESEIRGKK